jgi:hypothetical protein
MTTATAEREITLPYKFEPRDYQVEHLLKPLDSGKKRIVDIWHRRTGKDKGAWNAMQKKAYPEVGNYFYIFPSAKQGKKAIWDGIDNDGMPFLDHIPKELLFKKPNDTEMKITYKHPTKPGESGSVVQIVGGDSYNNVVGSNPQGVVFSEWPLMNPLAWTYIRPILKVNGGWAIFAYTPRGNNHGKDLYDMALANPDIWYVSLLTVDDTGILTQDDIDEELRTGMSWEMVQQEYYCSFEAGVPGSYYARAVAEARREDRIVPRLPVESGIPVVTSWDIGIGDSQAIWFAQIISPREIRFIDYYENNGYGIDHYHGVLQQKALDRGFVYAKHFGPHDLRQREWSSATTKEDKAREVGLDFEVVANLTREEGIELVRGHFTKFYFDESKCGQGIKALENYRKEYDEKRKVYNNNPLHDWSSNGADSMRYFAVGYETMKALPSNGDRVARRTGTSVKQYKTADPLRSAKSRTYQTSRN